MPGFLYVFFICYQNHYYRIEHTKKTDMKCVPCTTDVYVLRLILHCSRSYGNNNDQMVSITYYSHDPPLLRHRYEFSQHHPLQRWGFRSDASDIYWGRPAPPHVYWPWVPLCHCWDSRDLIVPYHPQWQTKLGGWATSERHIHSLNCLQMNAGVYFPENIQYKH